ncbi:MAG TPA: hypothetical protein VFD30_10550 [Terriglobia bacterium]|nr:hypothetical protein [Terriglobia bacterium]
MPRSWELEPRDNATIVRLTRSGFAGDATQARNHSLGWTRVAGWLQAALEDGETIEIRG